MINMQNSRAQLEFLGKHVYPRALDDLREQSKHTLYERDPVAWAHDVLGAQVWSKQEEILYSVVENRRTSVRSCNNAGKTYIAAVAAAWHISVFPPASSIVIATGPSLDTLERGLFHELSVLKDKAEEKGFLMPGKRAKMNGKPAWRSTVNPDLWHAVSVRPPEGSNVISVFQGIHRERTLTIIDESGGVSDDIYTAAERVSTTAGGRILSIGNPDFVGSAFWRLFYDPNMSKYWSNVHIGGFDTPRFTEEWKKFPSNIVDSFLDPEQVSNWREMYGEDDWRWKVQVLGDFPEEVDSLMFPMSVIGKAFETDLTHESENPNIIVGCDVGRGQASTVLYTNQNGLVRKLDDFKESNMIDAANRIHKKMLETGATQLNIDFDGIGGAVYDILETLPGGTYKIVKVQGSRGSSDVRRWANRRAEMYDQVRTKILLGEVDITPEDRALCDELRDIQQLVSPTGQILLESKRDMRTRGQASPDFVDAMVYAIYEAPELGAKPVNKPIYNEPTFYTLSDWEDALPW